MNFKSLSILLSICVVMWCAAASFAQLQPSQPTTAPASQPASPTMSGDAFSESLNFDKFRALSLQDRQTIKTWDTYARQSISQIAGRSRVEDRDPLFTLLDMSFDPEAYVERPILRIKNPQFLKDVLAMPGIESADARSIENNKAMSIRFWTSSATQQFVAKMQRDVIASRDTINQINLSANTLARVASMQAPLSSVAFVPPASGDTWHTLRDLSGNMIVAFGGDANATSPALPGYENEKVAKLIAAVSRLSIAWRERDVATVQAQLDQLSTQLPTLTSTYPAEIKRRSEVLYNKFYKLTLPGAAIYFVAFVLFITAAYSKGTSLRRWAIGFMVAGLLLHTIGIGIRWWLDQKSTGSWFYSIPIKNQFESVMMSAWFGMVVGLCLELWKKKSLFGAASSFVGWMSLVALFTVPYVFGKDIGNEIGRVNGILMSYWLYIHVTLATASYALIGMSFLLGVWWLVRYIGSPPEVRAMSGYQVSSDGVRGDAKPAVNLLSPVPALAGAGGIDLVHRAASDFDSEAKTPSNQSASASVIDYPVTSRLDSVRSQLANLDACNVVILQLAFWILGVAIVCGAIWADVSWGRPWGWDPKETFALVTWIIYLIIIHVRMVTTRKALWTSILCIAGFFVMLFNWIGVNYFLVGLHSYA